MAPVPEQVWGLTAISCDPDRLLLPLLAAVLLALVHHHLLLVN
jgi:hypothetical protein